MRKRALLALIGLIGLTGVAEARVALILKRTYTDAGLAKSAGIALQNLTPVLEMGGVDYQIFYVEDFGSTVAARLTAICNNLDNTHGITVAVWIGGTHNDVNTAWAPEVTQNGNTYSPDYPMIWATNDGAARLNFPSSGASDIRTGSGGAGAITNGRVLAGASAGFSTQAAWVPTIDTDITTWAGHVDVVAHVPADTTKMWVWRATSDTTLAHANGWSYMQLSSYVTNGPWQAAMAVTYEDAWMAYMIAGEIVHYAPQEWRRDRPIYWGIDVDDELQAHAGTNLSDGLPYSAAGTRDWYNTSSLIQLGDSLAAWGDVRLGVGVNPDSVGTAEGVAKRAVYNDPDYREYFFLPWHNHGSGRELNLYTTVAAVVAGGAAQIPNLRLFDNHDDSMWSTGGLQSSNFMSSMNIDSLMVGYSSSGLRYIRANTKTVATTYVSVTRTNPKTNAWLRRSVNGMTCVWYPWSGQSATDTTRYGAGTYTDAALRHRVMFTNHHLYRFTVVNHVPTFSYGRGVSPAVPPGLIWVQAMRAMMRAPNHLAGREIVAIGRPAEVAQNMYYRPRPKRW